MNHPFTPAHELLEGFIHLIYPHLCAACGAETPPGSYCFCYPCKIRLNETNLHDEPSDNEFTKRVWGRLPLRCATALFYFYKRNPIQNTVHQLKYHNRPDIGQKLGRILGYSLRKIPDFQSIDAIVAVPLHPMKERLRGYNQSHCFAQGIGEILGKPVHTDCLARQHQTQTQTRKKRLQRHSNVQEVFVVSKPEKLRDKHVLLVDDVLTTGATLEMCGKALLDIAGTSLSAATIAIAMKR